MDILGPAIVLITTWGKDPARNIVRDILYSAKFSTPNTFETINWSIVAKKPFNITKQPIPRFS